MKEGEEEKNQENVEKAKEDLDDAKDEEKPDFEIAELKEAHCEAKKELAETKKKIKEHAKLLPPAKKADREGKALFAEVQDMIK